MTNQWIIRPFQINDAPDIARIYQYYVEHTTISFDTHAPTAQEMAEKATHILEHSPYLIAEQSGEVIGYAYAKPWSDKGGYAHSYETTIYLAHDRDLTTTKGLGTALYQALIDAFTTRGDVRSLYGVVTANNDVSNRLHEKLGFQKLATFPYIGYKHEQWLDVSYWMREV